MSDVNLTVVHNGVLSHWAGVSTCGHILMDERLGLYEEGATPDLSWITRSTWGEMLERIKTPLDNPVYGELFVDFDHRKITDSTGAGYPFDLKLQWLALTWELPALAPVNKKSLRGHLKAGRLSFLDARWMNDVERVGEAVPKTLPELIGVYEGLELKHGAIARFSLPPGWSYEFY